VDGVPALPCASGLCLPPDMWSLTQYAWHRLSMFIGLHNGKQATMNPSPRDRAAGCCWMDTRKDYRAACLLIRRRIRMLPCFIFPALPLEADILDIWPTSRAVGWPMAS